jgi:hypothetical protein
MATTGLRVPLPDDTVVRPLNGHDRHSVDDRLVVCATGADEGGEESVALWWTSPSGEPKAGWLFPVEVAARDAAVARRLLAAAGYGRPAGRGPSSGWAVLARLARQTGLAAAGYEPPYVLDVDVLVARVRNRIGAEPPPARRGSRDRCAVVADVLETCRLIGWATCAGPANEPSPVEEWLRREPLRVEAVP